MMKKRKTDKSESATYEEKNNAPPHADIAEELHTTLLDL